MDRTFHRIEQVAWSERAEYYDRLFSSISSQAIAPILDSFGMLKGRRHLDVACGIGHLVGAAARRGAISEGIDFAQPSSGASMNSSSLQQKPVVQTGSSPLPGPRC
jgi:2-polyprenyl-3-methyl-5-hydroxy-6-metoxy-1,4-benzoquinol methylase